MPPSAQRQTAEALIDAFNRMDVEAIASFRSKDCLRYLLPQTLGYKPQNNHIYIASLQRLLPIFQNFSLVIHDILEDLEARKICMYLRARADTDAGEYNNEYMWLLHFDEEGKILAAKEFSDSVVERDFFPKLKAAMDDYAKANTEVQ